MNYIIIPARVGRCTVKNVFINNFKEIVKNNYET